MFVFFNVKTTNKTNLLLETNKQLLFFYGLIAKLQSLNGPN